MPDSDDYASEAIDRFLPRIPASLYEIAWQYSLYDWYGAVNSDIIDWEVQPKHLTYLTQRAKSELFGDDDSLIVVYADLSDPSNPSLRADSDGGPVEITTYTAEDRFRVGYSRPIRKTNQTAHSITTHQDSEAYRIAGLEEGWYARGNLQDRFNRWVDSEYADTVRENADKEDKEILDALSAIGDDEDEMERLASRFLQLAGGEGAEFDALLTVAIRMPGEQEFWFPGEIDVLNEVMYQKKLDRLDNISVDDASSEGTGFLTGEDGRVTGGSPGLFGMFGKKQREHFPDLDDKGNEAWRNRPLDFDTAAAIAAADSIFEDFYRNLGNSRRLYVLPYFASRQSNLSSDDFEWFYESVFERLREADDDFDDGVEEVMRYSTNPDRVNGDDSPFDDVGDTSAWDKVRIAAVHFVSGNPDRVFFDTLDAGYRPADIEDAHNTILGTGTFEHDGIFAAKPVPSSSPLLGMSLRLHRYVLYGGYFNRTTEPTRSSEEAAETPTAGDIDDYRMQRVRKILTGESLSCQDLLEDYLHKLVQEQRNQFGSDSEYTPVPVRSIVEQFVQIHALDAANALETTDSTLRFTTTEMTDHPTTRDERLEQFLDNHAALSEQHHRATFLLGALVGRVTAYQSREDISSTLVRRYPIDYLTKQTIKEVTKEVLQQDSEYAEAEDGRSYWTNSRYTTRLTDTMLSADPNSWSITDAELQWLYGLGIAYGLNDKNIDFGTADEQASEVAE